MAHGRMPQGRAKDKQPARRVVVRQLRLSHHSRDAGVALLQHAWQTLGLPAVLLLAKGTGKG